jgi:hypothetical protein
MIANNQAIGVKPLLHILFNANTQAIKSKALTQIQKTDVCITI